MSSLDLKKIELPASLPVFPLSGVLLLPGGILPLNIFEPRYRKMTVDALSSNSLIGIVQPETPDESPLSAQGEIKELSKEKLNLY